MLLLPDAIDTRLRCVLLAKDGETYKVSIEEMQSGKSLGEGSISRWLTAIEQPAISNVIPEVPRPLLHNNSTVLLVAVPSMGWAFVRPADMNQQRAYDDVVQNVLLAGLQATTTLQSPPQRGQTVVVKHVDGAHYRALCKRTSAAPSKYLIELIDFVVNLVLKRLNNPPRSVNNVPVPSAPGPLRGAVLGVQGEAVSRRQTTV
ncbi:uncharacterized protein LOC142985736 [Anticarsia gemmatalis]|uniref:uncharacterized protein LOC142985736 n=1 Tax=Anticarsia gemmatalis TaxID=129554 RepID=UPI003F77280A